MVLNRVRSSTSRALSNENVRRWAPVLMVVVTAVYLFLGAAAFFFLEHSNRESSVRKWNMNLGVNRRHFAKSISSRIFNDTRNLLIIIDRDQTDRVQQLLVESLKRYEERVHMETPDNQEWNLINSFNYAYGLLLTLGHGDKMPETMGGQIFSAVYSLVGVPLLMATIAMVVHQFILPFLLFHQSNFSRRLIVMQLGLVLYFIWALIISLFLYYNVFDTYWPALYTALVSAFTIQVNHYSTLSSWSLLILLVLVTVSVAIAFLVAFLFIAAYGGYGIAVQTHEEVGDDGNPLPQKFTVVVDEAGESKLTSDEH